MLFGVGGGGGVCGVCLVSVFSFCLCFIVGLFVDWGGSMGFLEY